MILLLLALLSLFSVSVVHAQTFSQYIKEIKGELMVDCEFPFHTTGRHWDALFVPSHT